MNVSVVGAGRMGGAMARRLRSVGFPVTVFNRTRARAEAVAEASGARVAPTAREAAAGADVVICSLADDAALRAVYPGEDGLAAGLRSGAVVCETSTVDPGTVRELEPLVRARGAALLDAPVSGSVPLVERGELTAMVGGDPGALEQARPALEALAARIFHVGGLGAGATMKLAVNAIVHALNQALSEALVLAERAGVERARAYEVFAASAAGAPFVQYKRTAFERPGEAPVAFSLGLVAKDLDLILALAERVGAPMAQARANREVVARALEAGMAEADMSAIAELLRRGAAAG
ncbi:MAG TPA: NAD(P)-dependent oxidoreductase [Actinomycetota bacterium]|nr:NAD(P)-dependent oxidoreductase [Actinomycetota bacterium]